MISRDIFLKGAEQNPTGDGFDRFFEGGNDLDLDEALAGGNSGFEVDEAEEEMLVPSEE